MCRFLFSSFQFCWLRVTCTSSSKHDVRKLSKELSCTSSACGNHDPSSLKTCCADSKPWTSAILLHFPLRRQTLQERRSKIPVVGSGTTNTGRKVYCAQIPGDSLAWFIILLSRKESGTGILPTTWCLRNENREAIAKFPAIFWDVPFLANLGHLV